MSPHKSSAGNARADTGNADSEGLWPVVVALEAVIARLDDLGLAAAAAHVSFGLDLVRARAD